MDNKSILVLADESTAPSAAAVAATDLAARTGARITIAYVAGLTVYPVSIDMGGTAELIADLDRQLEAEVEAFQAELNEALGSQPVEWLRLRSVADAIVAALYTDLVVAVGGARQARLTTPVDPAEVMLGSGKPVLVIPEGVRIGEAAGPAVIAWKPAREAARAVSEARPLLQRSASVTTLIIDPHIGPDDHGEIPGGDIGRYLARHGIGTTVETVHSDGVEVSDLLLRRAGELGAQLVVMGGYGHTRFREFVLGGTTRAMLRQRQVAILMAH